ncbi:AAA family ATPase [Thermobifida alba]|uniref:AAA family ATPase n=1 Tax=Thermobifida alba TaxID=53522 RepID=A0ABY4L2B3_THEAE|nr:AAA family ATPase [Thermobifida alba]
MRTVTRVLDVSAAGLVLLVGVSGAGKSTFAARRFRPTQVVSSDHCRALVSDDENDQSATDDAFHLLHTIVDRRLRRGLLTVVDATNLHPHPRQELRRIARDHDLPCVAIVLDTPPDLIRERTRNRADRVLDDDVTTRQLRDLRRTLRRLDREGFRAVHVLRGPEEADTAVVRPVPLRCDRRELRGPFDVIGDVHGCRAELEALLHRLGYRLRRDERGRATGAHYPGRTAVFVGDLVDRGPDSPGVLRLVMGMVADGDALCVAGNHENRLVRALRGRGTRLAHGLRETLEQLAAEPAEFRDRVLAFCADLVDHYVLDGGNLVVAHAGLKEEYHGRDSGRVRAFALYGETTGEVDRYGRPVRLPWARNYRGRAAVVHGHVPTTRVEWVNNTLCVDTGCVFGGRLTALRYPEREVVDVPAERVWYEPAGPLGTG